MEEDEFANESLKNANVNGSCPLYQLVMTVVAVREGA